MKAIFAVDEDGGIGKDGGLPWPKIPGDLERFKQLTTNGIVVMGRGTWESSGMPKPLPKRRNVVVSSQDLDLPNDVIHFRDISLLDSIPTSWIIGGAGLIDTAYEKINTIYLTRVPGTYECDTVVDMDRIDREWTVVHEEVLEDHTFQVLKRNEVAEQYKDETVS
jgi:dihydrofolate reductase